MEEEEPQSWADLLKQYEAGRNRPPPAEFYKREPTIKYMEGGIFSNTEPFEDTEPTADPPMDTSMYMSTNLFDEPEPEHLIVRPRRDHGLDLTAWPQKPQKTNTQQPQRKRIGPTPKDFDIISGELLDSPYKRRVQALCKEKQLSATFHDEGVPSDFFKEGDNQELEARKTMRLSRMSSNERRAATGTVNIITGDVQDEAAAQSIQEFSHPNYQRATLAVTREQTMVRNREEIAQRQLARVGCRYNNGRTRELRDFDIVKGTPVHPGWDQSVRMMPSTWEQCQMESL